jgi:DnaJ-class molecular chaperone
MQIKTWSKLSINKTLIVISFCLLILVVKCSFDFDPYATLDVNRNADERQIKNAYRKLAKHWHPDRNKEAESHDKFMKINQAYEVTAK